MSRMEVVSILPSTEETDQLARHIKKIKRPVDAEDTETQDRQLAAEGLNYPSRRKTSFKDALLADDSIMHDLFDDEEEAFSEEDSDFDEEEGRLTGLPYN